MRSKFPVAVPVGSSGRRLLDGGIGVAAIAAATTNISIAIAITIAIAIAIAAETTAAPAACHEQIEWRLLNVVAAVIAAEIMCENSPISSIAVEGRVGSVGGVDGPGSRRRARRTIPGVIATM